MAGIMLFLSSCTKDVKTPNIAISIAEQIGDSIVFSISGEADNITFYSGENGSNYEKREEFNSQDGTPLFQFVSQTKSGATLPKNLSVLVSTDFNGKYDADNVKAATWTNITDRVTFPTTNTDVSSGVIDLNDLAIADKPVYIAYRYLSEEPDTRAQRYFSIGLFSLKSQYTDADDFVLASSVNTGYFKSVDMAGPDNAWTINTASSTAYRLIHNANAAALAADDDWIISRSFDVSQRKADVAGSVNVKSIATSSPSTFSWKYPGPGIYTATFISQNARVDQQKESVTQISINIP